MAQSSLDDLDVILEGAVAEMMMSPGGRRPVLDTSEYNKLNEKGVVLLGSCKYDQAFQLFKRALTGYNSLIQKFESLKEEDPDWQNFDYSVDPSTIRERLVIFASKTRLLMGDCHIRMRNVNQAKRVLYEALADLEKCKPCLCRILCIAKLAEVHVTIGE
jgi:hypothetical protein